MSVLHFSFLGTPQVRLGTQPISFRTQKALALLIYLAMERGPHSREKLATLFWPDSDSSAGRANLRSTLMYLRKAVAHGPQQEPDHLLVNRQTLCFNRESAFTLDVERIASAAVSDDTAAMHEALALVRGEFLEGFSLPDAPQFDNWASTQREATHLQLNQLFRRLSRAELDAGQMTRVQQTTQQWLTLNPLEERAYRLMMQAQMAAGDRAGALQTYETCRARLQEELAVEPAPETQALAERIRTAPAEGPHFAAARAQIADKRFTATALPMVGRAQEHQALVEAFHRAQQDGLQVVTLEGEAGMGKTRLARAFLAWAHGQGAITLQGRAYETGGRLPYQPIVDLWRSHLEREVTGEDQPSNLLNALDTLPDALLAELSTLFPALPNREPQLSTPDAAEPTSATRLFEAVARLGERVARERPLVLFLDDLQWADVASLDLLQYAVRRWQQMQSPIMLLVTVRSEALVSPRTALAASELGQWLQATRRHVSLSRLSLGPLDHAVIHKLIRTLVHRGDPDALAAWLCTETAGQPFYLVETLASLQEMGAIAVVRTGKGVWRLSVESLPDQQERASFVAPGVRRLIRDRLSRLSVQAFELLAAAAVLGQEFTFHQLYRVADLEPDRSIRAMDELLAAHFLHSAESQQTYQFNHDKLRDVVYTEAGDARRHVYHRRALHLLQAESAPAARLAHHAQRAGEAQAAFDHFLQAGAEAMALFAIYDAAHFYEQARQVMVETEAVEVKLQDRRELYERLARAYELINRWADAETIYREMLAFARQNTLPGWTATALNRLALVYILGHWQPKKAIALLEQARESEGGRDSLIETECILSQVRQYGFDQEAAIEHAERAVSLAREHTNDELLARSLSTRAYACFGLPHALAQIEADARKASQHYDRQGKRALQVDSLAMVGHAQRHQGRVGNSVATLRQAHAIAVEIDNSWGQVNTAFHLAEALLDLGQYGEALQMAQASVATARAHGHDTLIANALCVRGTVYRAMRLMDRAQADHKAAQERFAELPFSLLPGIIAVHRCADAVLDGDWQTAATHAQQALDVETLTWLWVWCDAGFSYPAVVEALWRAGQLDAARAALQRYEEAAGDNTRYRLRFRIAAAALDQLRDEDKEAVAQWRVVVAGARELELPGELWPALLKLAGLEKTMGRHDAAQQARREATDIVQQLAANIDDEEHRAIFLQAASP